MNRPTFKEQNYALFSRFLWFILTVSAFGGAVYCALNQFFRYNSEPVVVSLQRDYRGWTTAFPAVTACFLERVDQEKARQFIFNTWNVTEDGDPEKYQYYYEFVELTAEISFRGNLQNFWKYPSDDTVKNIDLLKLALFVHPEYSLKAINSQNTEVEWVSVMTEEGLCRTFNSEYAKYQLANDGAWKQPEMMKCHYHSEACYVRIDSGENGIRYFIHSPFDIATAISNPTGEIYPGDELITDFKVVEIEAANTIKSLRSEQRRCKYPDEWLGNSIKVC
ncbi:uncharacterized protein LOC123666876 [Melitaea cinxia]|uniref:uncharacterized protein LOC123666876 n=1 Tax=Melitaea cinxia TaxID=113334 RepID=UPI001E273EFE|nr:uncharacterized protein LOC123666876 [Melitaea cinxia]